MAIISAVSICNVALAQIGQKPIHSLQDESAQAGLCATFFDRARIECLALHPWNFAIRRIELPPDADKPLYGYRYQFTLPADCLRILTVDGDPKYNAEGRKIVTDKNTAFIKYIADVSDSSVWSPGFIAVLTARLRVDLAYPTTKDSNQVALAQSAFELAYLRAKGQDSSEDYSDDFGQFGNSLLAARY